MNPYKIFDIFETFKNFPLGVPYLQDFIERVEADGGTIEKGALGEVTNYIKWLEWMGLYSDLFFVMPPLAYKTGKLYALYPTDGSGDMTVVRASYATRMNNGGLLEEVVNNTPRIDFSKDTPTILMENESTNWTIYSENLSSWGNVGSSNIADQETSPSGLLAYEVREDNSLGQHRTNGSTISTTIGDDIAISFFAKDNGRNIAIQGSQAGSFTPAIFDTKNGVVIQDGNYRDTLMEALPNGWYRCSAILTSAITAPYNFFCNLMEYGNTSYTYQGDGISGCFLWGMQLELQSAPTSYIPTSGASVTRLQDDANSAVMGTSALLTSELTMFTDRESTPFGGTYQKELGFGEINDVGALSSFQWQTNSQIRYRGRDDIAGSFDVTHGFAVGTTDKALKYGIRIRRDIERSTAFRNQELSNNQTFPGGTFTTDIGVYLADPVWRPLIFNMFLGIVYDKYLPDNALYHLSNMSPDPISPYHPDVSAWKTRVEADGGTVEDIDAVQTQVQDLIDKNLYYDGFFIAVPDGYKAGTLYALSGAGSHDMTVTRASYATREDSDGLLEQVVNDVPRIDYSEGEAAILMEKESTNVFIRSENLDHLTESNVTLVLNDITAPDGNDTADRMYENTSGGNHWAYKPGYALTDNTDYTLSMFVKAKERTKLRIQLRAKDGSFKVADIDLIAETNSNGTIEAIANGWYRVSLTQNSSTGATDGRIGIFLADDTGSVSYTGDGVSGLYVWGIQYETQSSPTSYIPTNGSTVTRLIDTIQSPVLTGTADLINNGVTNYNHVGSRKLDDIWQSGIGTRNQNDSFFLRSFDSISFASYIRDSAGTTETVYYGSQVINGENDKIAAKWNATTQISKGVANGGTVVESNPVATMLLATTDTHQRLCTRNDKMVYYHIFASIIFSKELTDVEMQDLTS